MPEYGSSSISTFDFNDLQKSVDNVPNNKILLEIEAVGVIRFDIDFQI